ncbi:MAG TPA: hypothetical protein VLV83_05715 [Acidobacteriota bacterium]|nr:hypothetical protein [Acidobacteriota bacterium]
MRRLTNLSFPTLQLFGILALVSTGAAVWGQDTAVPDSERQALIAFFESTGGENWSKNQNWLGPAGSEDDWFGVTVENGHVTRLSLPANRVDGTIPSEIGDLTELRELDLCSNICTCAFRGNSLVRPRCTPAVPLNFIRSALPESLGNLAKLEVLDLDEAGVEGQLPAFIGNLTSLRELRLNYNDFSGPIPESWGALTKLETLLLLDNQVSGAIPAAFGSLEALRTLQLSGNHLQGEIPASLGELTDLTNLSLSSNALTGLVPATLADIEHLGVSYNGLQIAPADRELFGERASIIESSQTAPPGDVMVEQVNGRLQFRLRWIPIPFLRGPGEYLIEVAEDPGGPFQMVARSDSKAVASAIVSGLPAGQEFHFRVRTRSGPNGNNANTIISLPGPLTSGLINDPPPPARLYLPSLQTSSLGSTGLALANLSDDSAEVQLTARGEDGALLPVANNPAMLTLEPGSQRALLAFEIFGANPGGPGWVEATSGNPDLAALFLVGDGRRLDGTSAFVQQSRRLLFSDFREGPNAFAGRPARTLVQLINPNPEDVRAQLRFISRNVEALEDAPTAEIEVPAMGNISRSPSELFALELLGFGGILEARVTEGGGLVGSSLTEVQSGEALYSLPATAETAPTETYVAQVVTGGPFFTRLNLNPSMASRVDTVSLRLFTENGLFKSRTVTLDQAGDADLATLLLLEPGAINIGSLEIRTSSPEVVGNVVLGHRQDGRIRAAVAFPAGQSLFRQALFGQIASDQAVFSGLALFNPNFDPALITLQAFSSEGVLLGEKELNLPAQHRISQLVRELLPEQGQLGGFLRLSSSVPIAAQEIIGDFQGEFLSSVSPFVIE